MLSDKLQNLLGRASMYSGLYANPDFQEWKSEIVDKRIESLKDNILKTDPDSDEHKKFVLRYQELKYITEDIFRIMKKTEDKLRKEEARKKGKS
ncbi:MAG: hypothetical protein ACTSUP_01655 [Candidatus Heimdallarchaeaceae archaeon]